MGVENTEKKIKRKFNKFRISQGTYFIKIKISLQNFILNIQNKQLKMFLQLTS